MVTRASIQQDFVEAQKARDEFTLSVLRLLISAFHNKEIEKYAQVQKSQPSLPREETERQSALTEEEIQGVVHQEVKKRNDAIALYQKGAREDLADREARELEILKQYMSPQASEEDIRTIVKQVIQQTGARDIKDFGKVMKVAMENLRGRAQGDSVSKIARELLE